MAKGFGEKKPKKATKRQKAYYGQFLTEMMLAIARRNGEVVNFIYQVLRVSYESAQYLSFKEFCSIFTHGFSRVSGDTSLKIGRETALTERYCESADNPQVLYQLLSANLDKLDDKFAEGLRVLGMYIKSQVEPEQIAQMFHRSTTTDTSVYQPDPSLIETVRMVLGMVIFSTLLLQFPEGNTATNLEIAIAGYEAIATVFTREAFPEQWGSNQNDLGIAYSRRIRGDRASNLEKALACYQNALQVFTRESAPETWGAMQINLAMTYYEQLKGDRADNIEQAIAYCQEILQVCTREAFAEQWGIAQVSMGMIYRERVRGNRSENLEFAICCYKAASQVLTREAFPQNWGKVQENLGVAYTDRIQGEPAENIEQAIDCFQAALQVHTRQASPERWVNTLINLGVAYRKHIKGDKCENIESAIHYYEAALQVVTLETMPIEWAKIQINLGVIYNDRIKGNLASNLETAIRCYSAALQVCTRRAFPQFWATIQNNLASVYGRLGQIQREIDGLEASLEVCTREAFPQDWADTQYNLGRVYLKLGQIDPAIECFRLSLEVFTPTAFPVDCLLSGRTLGDAAFKVGRWSQAIEAYNIAIEAVETSRTWATSESRRQEILEAAIDVYENMVQACVNTNQLDKAVEYVERSRSKRLVDLMASNDLYSGGEIPSEVEKLLSQYENLQQLIDRERDSYDSGSDRQVRNPVSLRNRVSGRAALKAYNEAIATLEAKKQLIWQELRSLDPVLAGQIQVNPLKLSSILTLIDQTTTAILSFYTTTSDTHIFVVQQNQITCHTCKGFGIETLQNRILTHWLQPYLENREKWKNQFSLVLAELAQCLQLNDLIAQHLNGIEELIIVPHLALHQIPFAALPVGDDEYLGDKFIIRYTPSCQVLEFCQTRPPRLRNPVSLRNRVSQYTYGTVEDATEDLPYASFEGEQLAALYNIPENQRLKGRRQATVSKYRELVQKVQVIHSSHHAQSRLDNPLESQLLLGDGSITLGQLMTPGWRLPQLFDVFLSCCETHLGVTKITDDILTLSTGFLCAGARSVVSTLWSVDDLATALVSIFYYQHREQGYNKPDAIARAQKYLRTLTGDTLATVYQPQLASLLEQKFKDAFIARKEAKTKRHRHQPDSDAYKQCDREYQLSNQIYNRIGKAKKHLNLLCRESFPFSHPFYWAAFTCSGLRH